MRVFLSNPARSKFLVGVVGVFTILQCALSAAVGFEENGVRGAAIRGLWGWLFGAINGIVMAALIIAIVWLVSFLFFER